MPSNSQRFNDLEQGMKRLREQVERHEHPVVLHLDGVESEIAALRKRIEALESGSSDGATTAPGPADGASKEK
jgi:hypothetical protein